MFKSYWNVQWNGQCRHLGRCKRISRVNTWLIVQTYFVRGVYYQNGLTEISHKEMLWTEQRSATWTKYLTLNFFTLYDLSWINFWRRFIQLKRACLRKAIFDLRIVWRMVAHGNISESACQWFCLSSFRQQSDLHGIANWWKPILCTRMAGKAENWTSL